MDTSKKVITLGALGVGGYLIYNWLQSPATPATPTTPSPSGSTPPVQPSTPATPPAPATPSLSSVYALLVNSVASDASFTGPEHSSTPYHFNYYVNSILGTEVDLAAAFPGVDLTQPMSLQTFWSGMSAYLKAAKGMAGIAMIRGMAGLGQDDPFAGMGPGFFTQEELAPYLTGPNPNIQVSSDVYAAAPGSPAPVTSWMNKNGKTVALVAAGGIGIALLARR